MNQGFTLTGCQDVLASAGSYDQCNMIPSRIAGLLPSDKIVSFDGQQTTS